MSINERVLQIRQNKKKIYDMMIEDLSELGFSHIEGRGDRYWGNEQANVYVLCNPFVASRVRVYVDFPQLGSMKGYSDVKDYQKDAASKEVLDVTITPEDAMIPELITSFIISEIEKYL